MISALVLQVIFPELLLTGACVTIVTVGVYFAIDNPAEKFRQHAYIDINTEIIDVILDEVMEAIVNKLNEKGYIEAYISSSNEITAIKKEQDIV